MSAVETSPTKSKRRILDPEDLERIESWLTLHDLDLYGRQSSATDAKENMKAEGFNLTGVYIGPIARRVCKFWLNEELDGDRRKARRLVFDGSEWHRMQTWIRNHRDELDFERDTHQSVARRMRHCGVICNSTSVQMALKAEEIDLSQNPRQTAVLSAGLGEGGKS